ncbi:MAG: hypothetical protein KAI71_00265 [Candidatus Pacebacteria bacterium]|nr:hypothetical protein [Candidatus Paceibacterota bacterium]
MRFCFWKKDKLKNKLRKTDEGIEEIKKTDKKVMEEIEEIKKKRKKEESDEWWKEYEKEKQIIREDVQVVIEELETLSVRCLKATKKGKDSIRIMKLKRRHLSDSNYSFKKLSYHYSHDWLGSYSEYINNSDIINLIFMLEGKGFQVFIEMEEYYHKSVDIDELKDSSIEWFNPNAYLSIRL